MTQRPLTPHDLLRLEELSGATLSPDGRLLAYVHKRSRATAKFHKYDWLFGGDRGDLWVVDVAGGEPCNLTNGARDGAGHWAPQWSPDSRRLALLSTRGGNVHAWTCEVESGTLARLSVRAVDLDSHGAQMLWVSDHEVLIAALPEGAKPSRLTVEQRSTEIALLEWQKAWDGREPTASVLDSGIETSYNQRPQGALVLVNAITGGERTVMDGLFRDLLLAPDGRHVAGFRQVGVHRPDGDSRLERLGWQLTQLVIVAADGEVVSGGVAEIERPSGTSLCWSADGGEVALLAHADPSGRAPRSVFRYRLSDGRVQRVTGASLVPASFGWVGDDAILAYGRPADRPPAQRADWWLLAGGSEPQNLSADLAAVPTRLFAEQGRGTFVGLGDGDILRLSPGDGTWASLTDAFEPPITSILWPLPGGAERGFTDRLVLTAGDATPPERFSLDLRSGELSALAWPSPGAWLLGHVPEHATAVHGSFDRTGARLWVSRPAFEHHRLIAETNTWLDDVAEGMLRRVHYRALDGRELTGWLILPLDHEAGNRHPTITTIYPGYVAGAAPPVELLSIAGHHAHNPQLLAAHGYAVLLPSIPLSPEGEASDPLLDLANGVLPAVDAAIELGIADPERLGLMGHSYGGYGTLGLITQTQRFSAAVAMAGISELVSLYGQFDPRHRYDPDAHEHVLLMSLTERGQLRMGAPPWRDVERYIRNSPLFGAGDVQTPVLIVQGDMDYVALGQGEQFFNALYRQGKRARLVRYWGEGHVLASPANVEDLWQRILGWFDELLG